MNIINKCNGGGRLHGERALIQGADFAAKQLAAFTLAEVLITLGIIGVVAAMTIPIIITNSKSIQYRTAYQKGISILSQAAALNKSQYDFDYGDVGRCSQNPEFDTPEQINSACSILNKNLKGAKFYKNASDIKLKDGSSYNIKIGYFSNLNWNSFPNSEFYAYELPDGILLLVYKTLGDYKCQLNGSELKDTYTGTENMNRCVGFIDVNGITPPNAEVSCSSGSPSLANDSCIVKGNKYFTDVYPIRFHDSTVAPASAAARAVLLNKK